MVSYLVLIIAILVSLMVGGTIGIFTMALMIAAGKDEDRSESESDCE